MTPRGNSLIEEFIHLGVLPDILRRSSRTRSPRIALWGIAENLGLLCVSNFHGFFSQEWEPIPSVFIIRPECETGDLVCRGAAN